MEGYQPTPARVPGSAASPHFVANTLRLDLSGDEDDGGVFYLDGEFGLDDEETGAGTGVGTGGEMGAKPAPNPTAAAAATTQPPPAGAVDMDQFTHLVHDMADRHHARKGGANGPKYSKVGESDSGSDSDDKDTGAVTTKGGASDSEGVVRTPKRRRQGRRRACCLYRARRACASACACDDEDGLCDACCGCCGSGVDGDACLDSDVRCITVCGACCATETMDGDMCACCKLCGACICWCGSRRARAGACWFCETLCMPPGTQRGNMVVFCIAWGLLFGGGSLVALIMAATRAPSTLFILPMFVLTSLPMCLWHRPLLRLALPPSDNPETTRTLASLVDCFSGVVATLAPGLMSTLMRTGAISAPAGILGTCSWASFYTAYIGILVAILSKDDDDGF